MTERESVITGHIVIDEAGFATGYLVLDLTADGRIQEDDQVEGSPLAGDKARKKGFYWIKQTQNDLWEPVYWDGDSWDTYPSDSWRLYAIDENRLVRSR